MKRLLFALVCVAAIILLASSAQARAWVCVVDLSWRVDSRQGKYSGSHENGEVTENAAMGRALFDAQQYLLARTLKGTKPAWTKAEVKCR
jgi:hypothetical protein